MLVGRAFALSVLVARTLGPDLYGVYSILLYAVQVAVQIVNLGYPNTIIRFVSRRLAVGDTDGASAVFRHVVRREFLWGLLTTAVMIILSRPLSANLAEGIPVWLFCFAALAVLPDSMTAISEAAFEGLLAYRSLFLVNIIMVPVSLAGATIILLLGGRVPELLALKIVVAASRVWLYRRFLCSHLNFHPRPIKKKLSRDLRNYARSLSLIFLFDSVVWQRSEAFFLAYYRSRSELAFYDIAYMVVGVAMRVLPEKLTDIMFPVLSGLEEKGDAISAGELYRRSTRLLFAVALCIAIGVFVYAPEFVQLVYGEEYLPVSKAIRIFCVASPIIIIARATAYVLYSAGWQAFNVRLAGGAAAINILLDFLLIPGGGIIGAAVANTATQLLSIVVLLTYVLKRKGINLPWGAFAKTLLAGAAQVGALKFTESLLHGWSLIAAGAIFSTTVYIVLLSVLGVLTKEEKALLRTLPKRIAPLRIKK